MKCLMSAAALALLTACSPPSAPPTENTAEAPASAAPSAEGLPAGAYTLDTSHSTVMFRVNHIGMASYAAGFDRLDAQLQLDPAHPDQASLTATIDPRSLDLPSPPENFLRDMLGPQWFDAGQFPQITYCSTRIEMTGANTARIHGDLTLHGITKPVVLEATFNGGYAGHQLDPNARIGFSARGTLNRSEFGMGLGVPPPGSTMGVSDAVEFAIETEFNGPRWTDPQNPAPAAEN